MSDLKEIKRPCAALIKLVEATGILLGIPFREVKSQFKAPTPSNYDDTILALTGDFYGCLTTLAQLQSSGVPNDVASDLFGKMSEPGFDYESAVNNGGLQSRELFNTVLLILMEMQADKLRPPLIELNVLVLVDNTRSSYVALDTATHLFSHGTCTIAVSTAPRANSDLTMSQQQLTTDPSKLNYIYADVLRRCKSQYKIPEYNYQVLNLTTPRVEIASQIKQLKEETHAGLLVLGVEEDNFGEDCLDELKQWAAWECDIPVVITKGSSKTRPYNMVRSSRKFMMCVKSVEDVEAFFKAAVVCFRPMDEVVVLIVVASRNPQGDTRDFTRFGLGQRVGWVNGTEAPAGPNAPGWNDAYLADASNRINSLLQRSQISGRLRLETRNLNRSIPQELTKYAKEEMADMVLLQKRSRKPTIVETIKELDSTIIIVK